MDGTAARLLIFTSMKSVNLFFGANSSKYIAANTAIGNEKIKHTNILKTVPIKELAIPASSASLESGLVKKLKLNLDIISPLSFNMS